MGDRQYYFSIKVQRGELLFEYVITFGFNGVLPVFTEHFCYCWSTSGRFKFIDIKSWNREISS